MARRAGDGRHPGSSWQAALQGPPAKHGLGRVARSAPRKRGGLRGPATGVSEARSHRERTEEHAARQPGTTRRSGSGVLKRQVHRSPLLESKLEREGRGASLEEMPGARRGAGTRSRNGRRSRSRSNASCSSSRAAPKGEAQRGRASLSQAVRSADAGEQRARIPEGIRGDRRQDHALQRADQAAETLEQRPASEQTVREGHARTSQGERGSKLCSAPRGAEDARMKRRASLPKQAGISTRRKAPRVVPPSSRPEEMAPLARGRWDDSGLSVKRTSRAEERARGRSSRSAWIRREGAAGRHESPEVGTVLVKALPAPI